jgi:hypothetical protein
MPQHQWNSRERALVAEMLRAKASASDISMEIGVSRAAVIGFVRRDAGLTTIGWAKPSKNRKNAKARRRCPYSDERRRSDERESSAFRKAAGLTFSVGKHISARAHEDWLKQLPFMPDDTRGITARLCGDPLPGRSALDRISRPHQERKP